MLDIQAHLERVSRSFAFCIARLDSGLREPVGLSYLLCRLLDTVEDAAWEDPSHQLQAFDQFVEFVSSHGESQKIRAWADDILNGTQGIPEGEKKLLRDAVAVFEAHWALPDSVRAILIPPIVSMAKGMRAFTLERDVNGFKLRLKTLQDVNRYCFFVAGVVGEILNGLLGREACRQNIESRAKLADGFHFGLFLQKVNLLKDRSTDLTEGRDLVPGEPDEIPKAFMVSALSDAKRAFHYISSIPLEFSGYRLFCSWSLFLGLASLPHILKRAKIGRIETVALLAKVEHLIHQKVRSNESLTTFFEHKMEPLEKEFGQPFHLSGKDVAAHAASSHTEKERCLEIYRRHYVGGARDEDLLDVAGWT